MSEGATCHTGSTIGSERIGWLRAAVLGANDGIVSTASLVVGVAAAASARQDVLIAGVAGLVAGSLSMAAGEYVSVSSQADTEQADLKRERHELATAPQAEEDELTNIYVRRGLEPELARIVARQLMAKGALAAGQADRPESTGDVRWARASSGRDRPLRFDVIASRAEQGDRDPDGAGCSTTGRAATRHARIADLVAAAIAVMVVVSALAGFLPARRASRVDPMIALRYD